MIARLMARVGLVTPEQRAWAWYDWANSAFFTTVVTAVFPGFYASYAAAGLAPAEATARFGLVTTVSMATIAISAPILGALADYTGAKKRLLAVFIAIGVTACGAMVFIGEGDVWFASLLFFIANLGVSGSIVFYDSLLPHVAKAEETDRVSSAGYAMGYIGGGLLLLINLAWILQPAMFGFSGTVPAIKAAFVSVAVWWAVFSLPIFRKVPEPLTRARHHAESGIAIVAAFSRLATTFTEVRKYRNAFLLFIAMLLYQDGIQTIIRMAGVYGAEVGVEQTSQIAAFVMVQFLGIPFSFLFGSLGVRIGTKRAIFIAISVYALATVLAYFMTTRDALLHPGGDDRHGAGRRAGAQPGAVLADGAGRSHVGVLRLLCGGRAVCDRAGPARVHAERHAHRQQPRRHHRDSRVLRRRRVGAEPGG